MPQMSIPITTSVKHPSEPHIRMNLFAIHPGLGLATNLTLGEASDARSEKTDHVKMAGIAQMLVKHTSDVLNNTSDKCELLE